MAKRKRTRDQVRLILDLPREDAERAPLIVALQSVAKNHGVRLVVDAQRPEPERVADRRAREALERTERHTRRRLAREVCAPYDPARARGGS